MPFKLEEACFKEWEPSNGRNRITVLKLPTLGNLTPNWCSAPFSHINSLYYLQGYIYHKYSQVTWGCSIDFLWHGELEIPLDFIFFNYTMRSFREGYIIPCLTPDSEINLISTYSGHLGGPVVEHLPLAQVVIPAFWDQVPHRAPYGSQLLPLPMSLSLSLCPSWINKYFLKNKPCLYYQKTRNTSIYKEMNT